MGDPQAGLPLVPRVPHSTARPSVGAVRADPHTDAVGVHVHGTVVPPFGGPVRAYANPSFVTASDAEGDPSAPVDILERWRATRRAVRPQPRGLPHGPPGMPGSRGLPDLAMGQPLRGPDRASLETHLTTAASTGEKAGAVLPASAGLDQDWSPAQLYGKPGVQYKLGMLYSDRGSPEGGALWSRFDGASSERSFTRDGQQNGGGGTVLYHQEGQYRDQDSAAEAARWRIAAGATRRETPVRSSERDFSGGKGTGGGPMGTAAPVASWESGHPTSQVCHAIPGNALGAKLREIIPAAPPNNPGPAINGPA